MIPPHVRQFRKWYAAQIAAGPQPNAPQAPTPRTDCIHLGDPLARQDGPCLFKLRRCDEFEVCTVEPCEKSPHSCTKANGMPCEKYVKSKPIGEM